MSAEDWFVPGGATIVDGGKLRLRPPEDWRRDIIVVHRAPPSMNSNQIRSSWRGFHAEKKDWQEELGMLLIIAKVPRRNQRAIAGAFMRFNTRQRRDPGNYSSLLNKALGDALVISNQTPEELRYIPDDDQPHYFFGGIEIEEELGPPRTTFYLYTQPKED